MLCNVTYRDKIIEHKLREEVGEAYTFVQSMKMGGTGSPKMIVVEAFDKMAALLNVNPDIKYCGLELRKRGILLSIRCRTDTWAWAIPFHLLIIFAQGGFISIYRGGEVVKIKPAYKKNKSASFFAKVISLKAEYQSETGLPGY